MQIKMMNECSFCSEFNGSGENSVFLNNVGFDNGITSRKLFETENWVVVPTLGSFVEGYLLIITKKHYISISECQTNLLDELEGLITYIKCVIDKVYNSPIIAFEHGAISEQEKGGCCVTHAHMHIVPYRGDIMNELNNLNFSFREIDTLYELNKQFIGEKQYIFYQNNIGKKYIFESNIIPSQYIRQVLCKRIGSPRKWDWRKYYFIDNIIKTLKAVAPIINKK